MTSFKCQQCGARWSEGPTRDHQEGAWCRKCIEAETNRFHDDRQNMALGIAIQALRQLATWGTCHGISNPEMERVAQQALADADHGPIPPTLERRRNV